MAFQVEELSIQLVEALVPLMPRIKQPDKALEDQLRRAASSIGLNCAEAAFSDPGNRRARFLQEGELSGVFEGDAFASVRAELGLTRQ
jgi:four helix bundle protein